MKRLLPIIFAILISLNITAQTNVSSNINANTTWTKANSPYTLNGDISIESGAILTVEPGVTLVRGALSFQLLVKGGLQMNGVETDSIFIQDSFGFRTDGFLEFVEGSSLTESSISYVSATSNSNGKSSLLELGNNTNIDGDGSSSAGELIISNTKIDGFYITLWNGLGAGSFKFNSSSILNSEIAIEGGFVSETQIKDSKLENVIINLVEEFIEFDITNSELRNSNINLRYDASKLSIAASKFYDTDIVDANNLADKRVGNYTIDRSEFVNSLVSLPKSFLNVSESVFYVFKNVTENGNGNIAVSVPLRVNAIDLSNSSIFADGGTACLSLTGSYLIANGKSNIISNSSFENKDGGRTQGALQHMGLNELTINNSNFYVTNTQAIDNQSTKNVNAQANYFDQSNTVEEIEDLIYHTPDDDSKGLVDFSGFGSSPFPVSLFSAPHIIKRRIESNGDYLDQLTLSFNRVDSNTEKLRIYKITQEALDNDDYGNRTFLQEVSSPFTEVTLDFLVAGEYLVTALNNGDSESWGGIPENEFPTVIHSQNDLSITEEEVLKTEIKVYDPENDFIKLAIETESNLAEISDFSFELLRKNSDTSYFELTFIPKDEVHGNIALELLFEDGINNSKTSLRDIAISYVNDYKPILSTQELIIGPIEEDTGSNLEEANFFSKISANDQDGDEVKYVITTLLEGELTGFNQGITGQLEIGDTLSNITALNWKAPANKFGIVDAFKVKATDTEFVSDQELLVQFDVTSINDTPELETVQIQAFERSSSEKQFTISGLSPGKGESDNITLELDIARSPIYISSSDVVITLEEDQKSATVDFDFSTENEVIIDLAFKLGDGDIFTNFYVRIIFYSGNTEPSISSEPRKNAYVDQFYNYAPEATDPEPVTFNLSKAPDFLLTDSALRVYNYAGSGFRGDSDGFRNLDGFRSSAQFQEIRGMAFDQMGNLFVSDPNTGKVKELSIDGYIRTFAGNGARVNKEGLGIDASFDNIGGMNFDQIGNLYVTDWGDDRVMRLSPDGKVERYLGIIDGTQHVNGKRIDSGIDNPFDIVFDVVGNAYVLGGGGNLIKKIDKEDNVTTYIDTSTPNASWASPQRMAINSRDEIIVSDQSTNKLFKIYEGAVEVITLPLESARSYGIDYLTDDIVVFSDFHPGKIYSYNLISGELVEIIGLGEEDHYDGITANELSINGPFEILVEDGDVYFNDGLTGNVFVIKPGFEALNFDPMDEHIGIHEVEILAQDIYGKETIQSFQLEVKPSDRVTASNLNQTIAYTEDETVDLEAIVISETSEEEIIEATLTISDPSHGILTSDSGNGEVYNQSTGRWFISGTMEKVNSALAAISFQPIDNLDVNSEILSRIILSGGAIPNEGVIKLEVTPINDAPSLANDPIDKTFTEFEYSFDVQVDDVDNIAYRMDLFTKPDWLAYDLSENSSSVFVGKAEVYDYVDGSSDEARIRNGYDVEIDSKSNLYFLDGNAVRKVDKSGTVTTIAGGSGKDDFILAYSLDIDIDDNLYITDIGRRRLTKITSEGQLEVILDKAFGDFADGDLETSRFRRLQDVAVDKDGNIFIADSENYCIRKIDKDGNVTTPIGSRNNPATPIGSFSDIRIDNMVDIEFDTEGNLLIATLSRIYKANFQTMNVELFAGNSFRRIEDGDKETGSFSEIRSLETDSFGNVYIGEPTALRRIDVNGQLTTLAGNTSTGFAQGSGAHNRFKYIEGIVTLSNGDLIVLDQSNNVLRKIDVRRDYFYGVPNASDIGQSNLEFSLTDGSLTANYSFSIDVQSNGMPVFDGLNNTFIGNEDDSKIEINGISLSEVESDPIELSLTLSNPESGKFLVSETSGASFHETTGIWEITNTQAHINEVLSSLEFYPVSDFFGKVEVAVKGKRQGGQFTREGNFSIQINPINDAPILELERLDAMVDLPFNLSLSTIDADADAINLIISNLPDWLKLKKNVVFEASTLMNLEWSSSETTSVDGDFATATSYGVTSVATDSIGKYYFAESFKIREIIDGKVVTLMAHENYPDFTFYGGINKLRYYDGNLYFNTGTRIVQFNLTDRTLITVAGSDQGETGDVNGQGTNARFRFIIDFISDRQGGWVVADRGVSKVKHVSSEGLVTTLAGSGNYGSIDGPALTSSFEALQSLKLDNSGNPVVLEGRRERLIKDGEVSTILPTENTEGFLRSSENFYLDDFGNHFHFDDRELLVYDAAGLLIKELSVRDAGLDGKESQMGWNDVDDLLGHPGGQIVFSDYSNVDIRKLGYQFEYKLVGTPPVGSEGNQTLTFTLQDGVGDDVVYQIPLTVASPDRPEITGFPQEFDFVEDDPAFGLDPISITTEDQEELFEVAIIPSLENIGVLSSSRIDLGDSLKGSIYRLSGNAEELNEVLGSLSFEPGFNNDQNGQLDFAFKRFPGNLETNGSIDLSVTAVNDLPEILNLKDTTAYVGDSLSILFDAFDVEDGPNVSLSFTEKPDWLNYTQIKAQDELLAGTPGKPGLKLGKGDEAQFDAPFHMALDTGNSFVFVSLNTHNVLRLDDSGEVSLVAGDGRRGFLDGPVANARFDRPSRVVSLKDGSLLITDLNNEAIRLIKDGQVTTLIGPNSELSLSDIGLGLGLNYAPISMALSHDEKTLILGRYWQIRFITLETLNVESLDIISLTGSVNISMIDVANNGDLLVSSGSIINRFSSSGAYITRYGSGNYGYNDGPSNQSQFAITAGAVEDPHGNIYVIDRWNYLIRKIDVNGNISTVLGSRGATGYESGINESIKINTEGNLLWKDGHLIFADNYNHVIRKIKLDQKLLSGTPSEMDLGEAMVNLVVKDPQNEAVTAQFNIDVLGNDRPVVTGLDTLLFVGEKDLSLAIPKIEILEDLADLFELKVHLEGNQDHDLGTSETNLFGFDEDEKAWLLSGTGTELNEKLATLKLYSDNFTNGKLFFDLKKQGGNLSKLGSITILAQPENDAPILSSVSTYEVVAGEPFELVFEANDEDSEVISFTSQELPNWLFGDSTRLIQSFYDPIYSDDLPDSIKSRYAFGVSALAQNSVGQVFMTSPAVPQIFELMENGTRRVFAGNTEIGYKDGNAAEAMFYGAEALVFDSNDNLLVGESTNQSLRSIDPEGNVTTRVGDGRPTSLSWGAGQGNDAQPFRIKEIAIDDKDNIYSGEFYLIGKTDKENNYSALAGKYPELIDRDGDKNTARFRNIQSIVVLGEDSLLTWEVWTYKLKRYANERVETIGGGELGYQDGPLENAKFGVVLHSLQLNSGEILFADNSNYALRILNLEKKNISTLVGKGYSGDDYGMADESAIGTVSSLVELDNGDILFGQVSKVKRLAYSMPKITGTPELSDIGEHKFTLRISDGKDGIIEEEITINVIAPNTPPITTEISDIEKVYGSESSIEVSLFDYFSDIESSDSELSYELTINTDPTVLSASDINSQNGLLILTINNAGETELTVEATDQRGLSVSNTFKVLIEQANAEISVTYDPSTEEDGTGKSVTVTTVPADLLINVTYNGSTDLPVEAGTYEVVVSISERNYKGTNTSEFVLLTANTAPTASEISDIEKVYGSESSIEVSLFDYFSDVESSDTELSYELTINTDPTVLSASEINSQTGLLNLTINNAGETELTVEATDQRGLSVSNTFKVVIEQANAEINVTYDANTEEDGTSKSVTVTTVPADLLFNITYNGSTDLPVEAGTYEVVVSISERNYKGTNTSEFVLLTANTAPTASEIPDILDTYAPELTKELSLYEFFDDAEQEDNQLTYEVLSISDETVISSSEIDGETGILKLIGQKAGTTTILLKATDERGLSVTNSVELTINKATASIVFGSLEFVNDGEAKPVSVTTVPDGLNFDLTYNDESAVPNTVGLYNLKVVVDDINYEGEATAILDIKNIDPSEMVISNQSIFENAGNSVVLGEFGVTDENGVDTHVFSLVNGEEDNDAFEISGKELFAKSSFNFESKDSYTIKVNVVDNHGGTYTDSFQIDILDVNEAPTINQVDEIQIVKDLGELTIDLSGLSAGEDENQTISVSTASSGVVANSSVVLNSNGSTASLTFETSAGSEGNGTVVVTVMDNGGTENNGVDSKSIEIPIVVSGPNITVTSGSNCGDGNVSLSASGADGYSWYTVPIGGEAFDQGADISVSLTESKKYYVAGVFGGNESTLRIPVDATIFETLEVPAITNTDNILSVPQISGLTYQWFKDGIELAGEVSNTFTANETGSYTVTITNENGCFATSLNEDLVITGLENKLDEVELVVYPVPASDFVNLEFEEVFKAGTTVQLIGSTGRVFSTNTLKSSTSSVRIDVRNIPSGTHTILVRDGVKFARKRIIIQR